MADGMDENSRGAIAFVEHWIDEFNTMRATGDTAAVDRISTPNCESCVGSIDLTEELYQAGGAIETEGWKVLSVSEPAQADSQNPTIGLRVLQAPQRLIR